MKKLLSTMLTVCMLLFLPGCVDVSVGVRQEDYDALEEKYNILQAEYDDLQARYDEVVASAAEQHTDSDLDVPDDQDAANAQFEQTTDWLQYYKESQIEVISVDWDVLYEYGAYYSGATVYTAITVKDNAGDSLKATTESNDSFFFSFVFKFEDKSEIEGYDESDIVAVIGVVQEPTSIGSTITLEDCHIVSVGADAESLMNELKAGASEQIEYAESVKAAIEQAEAERSEAERQEFMESCAEINYSDIERNPDNYDGTPVKVSGKVIQVIEGWFNSVALRVDDGGNIWYVTYIIADGEDRILEDDVVTVYGTCSGVTSYTALLGNQVTLPSVSASYIE